MIANQTAPATPAQLESALPRLDSRARVWVIAGGFFLFALAARIVMAAITSYPSLDDPTYYIKVAENLLHGQGMSISVLWNYQPAFDHLPHPSNDYWMPLTSLLMWPVFLVAGSSYAAAQVPGVLAGALLAPMTYLFGRRLKNILGPATGETIAVGAAVLVSLNAVLVYQSTLADGAAISAVLGLAFVDRLYVLTAPLAGTEPRGRTWPAAVTAGVLAGLAYLTRSSAVLLLFGAVAYLAVARGLTTRAKATSALLLCSSALVTVLPWLIRNYLTFGFVASPTGLASVFATSYAQLFSYTGMPGLQSPGAGWGDLLSLRLDSLWHGLRTVLDFAIFPTSLPALVGLAFLARRHRLFAAGWAVLLAMFFGLTLIFAVPTLQGTLYHSVGAFVPLLYLGYLYGISRLSSWPRLPMGKALGRAALAGVGMICLLQLAMVAPAVAAEHAKNRAQFTELATWLRERNSPVVMTDQPATLHYASGLPAVMLPVSDPADVALEVARRYGVRYLVVTSTFGEYPAALDGRDDFKLVDSVRAARIYEVSP